MTAHATNHADHPLSAAAGPACVLDERLRIVRANVALAHLLGLEVVSLAGRSLFAACGVTRGRTYARRMVRRALGDGRPARVRVKGTARARPAELEIAARKLERTDAGYALATVARARPAKRPRRSSRALGSSARRGADRLRARANGPVTSARAPHTTYEVSVRPRSFGRYLTGATETRDERCFSALYGRDVPCEGCPVFARADVGVVPRLGHEGCPILVVAASAERGKRHVTATSIPPEIVGALLRARLEQLAAEAALSQREREVARLLWLGRNLPEIGIALDISPRTAKFHKANVLRKLGADSRDDLLRLLL